MDLASIKYDLSTSAKKEKGSLRKIFSKIKFKETNKPTLKGLWNSKDCKPSSKHSFLRLLFYLHLKFIQVFDTKYAVTDLRTVN